MKLILKALVFAIFTLGAVCAWGTYSISILPTTVSVTWFDYMIGGYSGLPMQEVPAEFGGGRFLCFHRSLTYSSLRKIYFAYVDDSGELYPMQDVWQDVPLRMGYPSLAVDKELGKPFYAWHQTFNDSYLNMVAMYDDCSPGLPYQYGPLMNITEPPDHPAGHENDEFVWPILKIGPSPLPGNKRIYALGKNMNYVDSPSENVLIAYADYDSNLFAEQQVLDWSYTTIPELDSWNTDQNPYWRRMQGSLAVGPDGRIYYAGNHFCQDSETDETVIEPDLDVFVCNNYGEGTWQRCSMSSIIPSFNPYSPIEQEYAFTTDEGPIQDEQIYQANASLTHFNIVLDHSGKLHTPVLQYIKIGEGSNDHLYYSIKDFVFDTNSYGMELREIFPVAGSSNDDLWWTPWDTDGDQVMDHWPGNADLPQYFPFCHWDIERHDYAMRFHYNYIRLTEEDADGSMACLWQDSHKARLYNLAPEQYAQYSDYVNAPEIMIAVTSDHGMNWQQPITLSSVETPELGGMIPMWVYPSDFFVPVPNGREIQTKRLYLMFLDDDEWGTWVLTPGPIYNSGNISYLALDMEVPVSNSDPFVPPAQIIELAQNYPNPFNPSTTISFRLREPASLSLDIYNLKGQKVKSLLEGSYQTGEYQASWDGTDSGERAVSGGVYFFRLKTGAQALSRKMLLLK